MANYREQVVERMRPDDDGMRVIDSLYARGLLDTIPKEQLKVLIGKRPRSKDRNAYMKWYKLAKRYDVMPPKGKSKDRKRYNRQYYRDRRGKGRGGQAWDRVSEDAKAIIERLESLVRYADMKARETRQSTLEPPD